MRMLLAAVLLLVLPVAAAPAQQVLIPDNPRAARVTLTPIVKLGSINDPAGPQAHSVVTQDSRGFYYVWPTSEPGTIARYHKDGRYLGIVGRRGKGPGEFENISALAIGPGDSIFVYDQRNMRITVIGPDAKLARHFSVAVQARNMKIAHGRVYLSGARVGGGRGAMSPMHVLSMTGQPQAVFGRMYRTSTEFVPPLEDHRLFAPVQAGLWVAPLRTYVLEKYSPTGTLIQSGLRRSNWFPPNVIGTSPVWAVKPGPSIEDISVLSDGRVWVLARLADAKWRPATPREAQELVNLIMTNPAAIDLEPWWDTRLELIDPRAGRVVAAQALGADVRGFAAPGLLYGTQEDASGDLSIVVWSLSTPK